MHDFEGRTAVITGAGSGIGAALARRAANEGMNVVLADIQEAQAQEVATAIGADRALALRCDVSDESSVAALADAAYARFGTVDLLCNNAGIVPGGRHRKVWEYGLGDWQWSLGVNLYGVVHEAAPLPRRGIAPHRRHRPWPSARRGRSPPPRARLPPP